MDNLKEQIKRRGMHKKSSLNISLPMYIQLVLNEMVQESASKKHAGEIITELVESHPDFVEKIKKYLY